MCPYGRVFLMSILYGQFLQPSASASLEDCALSFLPSGLSEGKEVKIAEETSQKIKNMSIICAMLVVTIHVGWPHKELCPTWFIYKFIKGGIAPIAVPFFFVVSGFFLAAHFNEPGWLFREIKKRIHSLLIPFFVWSVICFFAIAPLSVIADLIAHRPFGTNLQLGDGRWIHSLGLDVDKTPALTPLWYVRCLFFFVLVSPLFKAIVDRFGKVWLMMTFAIALIFASIRTPTELLPEGESEPFWFGFFAYGISLSGIFYFSLGIYFRKLNNRIGKKSTALLCLIAGAIIVTLNAFLSLNAIRCPFSLGCISIPLLMYGTWYFMPSTKWPNWLTSCSFSIFLLHCILLGYCGIFLKHLHLNDQLASTFSCIGAIIGSILITNLGNRFFPRLTHFLFAGRS